MVDASTDARNATLAFWNENGGRNAIILSLSNAFKYLQSVLRPIGKAFRDFSGRNRPTTCPSLNTVVSSYREIQNGSRYRRES